MSCKGSDSMLLLRWLRLVAAVNCSAAYLNNDAKLCVKAIEETASSALSFWKVLVNSPMWLERRWARIASKHNRLFLSGYSYLADSMERLSMYGFSYVPKFHYFDHIGHDLDVQLDRGNKFVLNPLVFDCSASEDYIGVVARASRRVSPRLTPLRTIQRCMIIAKSKIRAFIRSQTCSR